MSCRTLKLERNPGLVEVKHLVKYFPVRAGLMQRVVQLGARRG